jgi:hypothetical protein
MCTETVRQMSSTTKYTSVDPRITYILPVEDGDPYSASLLQGFAPSLMANAHLINFINSLPSDIHELTPEGRKIRLHRRICGQAPVTWYGQSPRALKSLVTPPFLPFLVLILGRNHQIEQYQGWIDAHEFPLTVIAENGGTLSFEDFSIEGLRDSFLRVCDAIREKIADTVYLDLKSRISSWKAPEARELAGEYYGHNAFLPNYTALNAAGFEVKILGPFKKISNGISPYAEVISHTANLIHQERERLGLTEANRRFGRTPGLNLFAPAIYPHFRKSSLTGSSAPEQVKKDFIVVRRSLEQQNGYGFEVKGNKKINALFRQGSENQMRLHPVIAERASELALATACIGTLAASEISSVIRLPNSVNRTFGQLRLFSDHYRAQNASDFKRQKEFKRMQDSITSSVPQVFLPMIESAEDGIRLVCDAPIEWMRVRNLPLCVQKDVTRIPVTPGNLFVQQVTPKPYLHLSIQDFEEILIVSALADDDPISPLFKVAIDTFAPHFKEKLRIRSVRVRNSSDLVSAMNDFDGSMMIFDGHGSHQKEGFAVLRLLEEDIDIWKLHSQRPRVPPIVVLSACDTHAADRNHASTANGFLSIGARTVLASSFPIDARDAAPFVARLLYRVAEFIPTVHEAIGRSLTWMEIMGGMIRMQLLTDFCRRLQKNNIIDHDLYMKVHLAGNIAINSGVQWPFESVIAELKEHGVDEGTSWKVLQAAVAHSTAMSYMQMGRPETIIVHPDAEIADRELS